jgi:hypothetical protein
VLGERHGRSSIKTTSSSNLDPHPISTRQVPLSTPDTGATQTIELPAFVASAMGTTLRTWEVGSTYIVLELGLCLNQATVFKLQGGLGCFLCEPLSCGVFACGC